MANSKFSRFVFTVIDLAGVNDDIKCKRIESQKRSECCSSKHYRQRHLSCIYTGSTSEGTVPASISDNDVMVVLNDTICVDKANFYTDINTQLNILIAENENIPPGYIKAAAGYIPRNGAKCSISAAMFSPRSYWYGSSTNSAPYISNKASKKQKGPIKVASTRVGSDVYEIGVQDQNPNGPALTFKMEFRVNSDCKSKVLTSFEYDAVYAVPYYNTSILKGWSSRARNHDWPSKELIDDVSSMEGFVIPVGEKKSETEHIEWRISHVTSEKILLQSFNSTQYKLYVILKLFSKQVFTAVSKSFSSYMVKNIVLWVAEKNPMHHFTPDHFIDCILQSFNFIKNCLICNHLPSYIMPKKNLLAGRLVGHEKRDLIYLLSCLLEEGAFVIYRLPKLAECLTYASIYPHIFSTCCIWRQCVEIEMLSLKDMCVPHFDPKFCTVQTNLFDLGRLKLCQDKRLQYAHLTVMKLLVPDYLQQFPNINFGQMTNECQKRIQIVKKCFFLEQ